MVGRATNDGNWWDKLGKPQYGGTMTLPIKSNIVSFDPCDNPYHNNIMSGWLETLHADNWTMDPSAFPYKLGFRSSQYIKGCLAKSWEFTDPSTYVVHLRKGIRWQDIPPVNGREFTADDVAYHYDRLYGLGHGFTKPGLGAILEEFQSLISVTAINKYTVVFKWNIPNPEFIMETIQFFGSLGAIEPPEAVEKWGDIGDWHHAIGTGPFILKDFVPGSEATLVKNPNYWGHDERYPQNQLPYIDKLKILIIPDTAMALEALRTGKIDALDGLLPSQAQAVQKTNPEILQVAYPAGNATTIDPRNDRAPFNDIRVRKAMQMAIDLPTICSTHYGGTCLPYPSTLTSNYMIDWGFPYEEWPQDLKDEYAYNPTVAKQLLADAGYPNGFKTNIVADDTGDMGLLRIVKSYFAAVGVDMEIRKMDSAETEVFVHGHKHDQLAQRGSVGRLGSGEAPILQLGQSIPGSPGNYMIVNNLVYEAYYRNAMAATTLNAVRRALRDSNEYVARQHFVISLLTPMQYALYQPWLKGYNGQDNAISGPAGPQLLFFYPARFWIDQKLKKSIGH